LTNDENRAGWRGWASRNIGSGWQFEVFYALIRLAGRPGAYLLLHVVVGWYVLFRPSVRERCGFYLARRFPEHRGWKRLRDTYRLSLELGKVMVDRSVYGILGERHMRCNLEGREMLAALAAEGHGLILVTAHAGSWQLGMSSLQHLDASIALLLHRDPEGAERHFFEHREGPPPYRIIDPAGYLGGSLEMLQVLQAKGVLCIMGDRTMGSPESTVPVPFLGGEIRVPFSPYKLASATGAPIAVIFPHKTGQGTHALHVAGVVRVPEGLGRKPQAYEPYAREFAARLEEFVRDYPYQFFNFFDMWNES
jgi:predicted LPLAT superfamily acyltransferase